jgi:hypothetical protein
MVGQILPNNNEKCYSNFSPKFSQLNTAYEIFAMMHMYYTSTCTMPLLS